MEMALQPNKFGKYKKADVLKHGYEIIDYGFTATEIKRDTGVSLTPEQRLKHCIGFQCERAWRGCVPVFDILDIAVKDAYDKL